MVDMKKAFFKDCWHTFFQPGGIIGGLSNKNAATGLDIGKVGRSLSTGQTLQYPQAFNHIYIPEETGGERQIVNLKWCLPAFGRIREDIMNHQKAADHDVPGPGIIVGEHCLQGMSAVDEHQA